MVVYFVLLQRNVLILWEQQLLNMHVFIYKYYIISQLLTLDIFFKLLLKPSSDSSDSTAKSASPYHPPIPVATCL